VQRAPVCILAMDELIPSLLLFHKAPTALSKHRPLPPSSSTSSQHIPSFLRDPLSYFFFACTTTTLSPLINPELPRPVHPDFPPSKPRSNKTRNPLPILILQLTLAEAHLPMEHLHVTRWPVLELLGCVGLGADPRYTSKWVLGFVVGRGVGSRCGDEVEVGMGDGLGVA
jgi:hypothetical protein